MIVGGSLLGLGALGVAVGAIAAVTCSGPSCNLGGEVVAMFSGVVAGVGLLVLVPGIILMSVSDQGRKDTDTSTAQSARTPVWHEPSELPTPRYATITFSILNGTF